MRCTRVALLVKVLSKYVSTVTIRVNTPAIRATNNNESMMGAPTDIVGAPIRLQRGGVPLLSVGCCLCWTKRRRGLLDFHHWIRAFKQRSECRSKEGQISCLRIKNCVTNDLLEAWEIGPSFLKVDARCRSPAETESGCMVRSRPLKSFLFLLALRLFHGILRSEVTGGGKSLLHRRGLSPENEGASHVSSRN